VDIQNRDVILVEDIIDSGHTIAAVFRLTFYQKTSQFMCLYFVG